MKRSVVLLLIALLSELVGIASPTFAQTWPQRQVKFIVPLGPEAGADIGARLFADRLTSRWGQPVVVENCPGGDGIVAINALLAARNDHTFMFGPASSFVGHPYLHDKLPYDATDLLPVARVSSTVVALAIPGTLNVSSLKELLGLVREQPGKFNWVSVTTVTDINFTGYFARSGLDMTRISYRDIVNALNDLVEARIHPYGAAYAIVRGQAQGGRIKLIAVTNSSRISGLDLQTVAEAGPLRSASRSPVLPPSPRCSASSRNSRRRKVR